MSDSKQQLIRIENEDSVPVITLLTPELRADSVISRLEQVLEDFIQRSGSKYLVLDMTSVHFLSSSGLRILILLRKRLKELGGRFTMCCVHPYVADVFKTTRLFAPKFDYYDDIAGAIAALKPPAES